MEVKFSVDSDFVHRTYEKLNTEVEMYTSGTIKYYITSNGGATRITWIAGNLECSIFGNFEINEIYNMIDSIHEG